MNLSTHVAMFCTCNNKLPQQSVHQKPLLINTNPTLKLLPFNSLAPLAPGINLSEMFFAIRLKDEFVRYPRSLILFMSNLTEFNTLEQKSCTHRHTHPALTPGSHENRNQSTFLPPNITASTKERHVRSTLSHSEQGRPAIQVDSLNTFVYKV